MPSPNRSLRALAALALLLSLSTLGASTLEARPNQPLVWRLVTSGQPSLRMDPFISTDSVSKRGILFGGASSAAPIVGLDDTWEFDGNAWNRLNPSPTIVGPRHGCGQMAFDPFRNLTVLFGGYGHLNLFGYNDVYEFNGSAWNLNNIPGPWIGNGASVVYDEARRVFVLFGGYDPWTGDRGTYTYDGQHFNLVASMNQGPSPRIYAGMAYDPIRQKTYLYGGRWEFTDPNDPQNTWTDYYDDTWEWDGTRWTQLFPAGPRPSKRNCGGMMIWHPTWEKVVIHGGSSSNLFGAQADTWTWDGTQWEMHATQNTPTSRYGICWYDEKRDALMMFGGLSGIPLKIWDETWELVDGVRTNTPVPSPSATPTPTSEFTGTNTPTPTNTDTPTITPTPTPVPGGKMGVRIEPEWDRNERMLTVDLNIYNRNPASSSQPIPVDLYVAVELYGVFYFYPAFTETLAKLDSFLLQPEYDSGLYELFRLRIEAPFAVPIPMTWYAALIHQVTGELVGTLGAAPITMTP